MRITATNLLISVFLICYLAEVLIFPRYEKLFYDLGFSAKALLEGKWWCLLTSIFLHASPEHLAMNSLALFFFGHAVEEKLGKIKTLFIFFISAIVGELFVLVLSFLNLYPFAIPTVGASAGIFGLMGVAMLVKPFEFIFYPYLIPLPLFLIGIIYALSNLLYFAYHLATGIESDISYAAHLGGLLAGIYFGLKEEREKRALAVLLIILAIALLPFFLEMMENLEQINYLNIFKNLK